MLADAAGHDAGKVIEIGIDVQAYAMKRHPFADAHTDGGNLVFGGETFFRAPYPDAHAAFTQFAFHVELCQRGDQPGFEVLHEGAHIRLAAFEVEHDIGHALPRPVIGVLPAAPGAIDGEALRVDQVGL